MLRMFGDRQCVLRELNEIVWARRRAPGAAHRVLFACDSSSRCPFLRAHVVNSVEVSIRVRKYAYK